MVLRILNLALKIMIYLETFCFQADVNCLKQHCCGSGFGRSASFCRIRQQNPGPADPGQDPDPIYFTKLNNKNILQKFKCNVQNSENFGTYDAHVNDKQALQ